MQGRRDNSERISTSRDATFRHCARNEASLFPFLSTLTRISPTCNLLETLNNSDAINTIHARVLKYVVQRIPVECLIYLRDTDARNSDDGVNITEIITRERLSRCS